MEYDFELDKVVEHIKKAGARRILLQLPNGLKRYHEYIVDYIESRLKGISIYVSLAPTYGACDVAVDEARRLGVDLIVHVGHNKYPYYEPEIPVIFVNAYYKWKPDTHVLSVASDTLRELNCKSIALASVIQHIKNIDYVKEFLELKGFKVIIPKPLKGLSLMPGQVLGCEYSSFINVKENVDCYLIIAGGMFHALGLWLATRKHVVKLDPYENKVVIVDKMGEKVLKKRYMILMKALDSKSMGIIDGVKPGQHRPWLVKLLEKKALKKGLKVRIYTTDYLDMNRLINIDTCNVDFYVITLCPRIPIDDLSDYHKPVLTPGEALMVLDNNLSDYRFPW